MTPGHPPAFGPAKPFGLIPPLYQPPLLPLQNYPETAYTNGSWWAIRELIALKQSMVPWQRRHRNVFMRHFGGVGYRKTLLPVLIVGAGVGGGGRQYAVFPFSWSPLFSFSGSTAKPDQ